MTFVITALHPEVGMWQSTDQAISLDGRIADEDWCKQVLLLCRDGVMLLGYSGLANTPDGQSMAEWIAGVSAPSGVANVHDLNQFGADDITCEQTLQWIVEAATETFSRSRHSAYRRQLLTIGGGAFTTKGMFAAVIGNAQKGGGGVGGRFGFAYIALKNSQPLVTSMGSGVARFRPEARERVAEIVKRRPRRMTDYLGLLAAENARVGKSAPGVSEWCRAVSFLCPRGAPSRARCFTLCGYATVARFDRSG